MPGHYFWQIVTDDDQAIGVLWVYENATDHTAFIYQIALDGTQRNRGYGSEALHTLEQELRLHGIHQLALHVFGDNQRAFRFYEKAGYSVTGITEMGHSSPGV